MRGIRTTIKNASLVEERRELIISRAIALFLRDGYASATMSMLAKECGMSTAGLYQYVGSKADILHLIALSVVRGSEALQLRTEISCQEDVTDSLRKFIRERALTAASYREGNMFLNREMRSFSREDRRLVLESVANNVHSCEALLERGVQSGRFKIRSSVLLANEIIMIAFNWGQRRWFLEQYTTLEDYIETWTENILDMILVDRQDVHR